MFKPKANGASFIDGPVRIETNSQDSFPIVIRNRTKLTTISFSCRKNHGNIFGFANFLKSGAGDNIDGFSRVCNNLSDSLLLPSSDHKKGKKVKEQLNAYGQEFSTTYFKLLESCQPCDPEEKKAKNAELTESLISNGGPAVNQFKKMIGDEKTAEFLRTCMFCSANESGE